MKTTNYEISKKLKEIGFKREKLNLWLRIKLFFKPTKISWDVSSPESLPIRFKECDGKILILGND